VNGVRRDTLFKIQEALGYTFKDINLLEQALTHRSYIHGKGLEKAMDNERLEFLGDAVLNLAVSDLLMKMFPTEAEGLLSRRRATWVNEQTLVCMANHFNLGEGLLLGKGEEISGGRTKPSLLANAMEAIIAAIYLDGGFMAAHTFVSRWFQNHAEGKGRDMLFEDYKSLLQEWCQAHLRCTPRYITVNEAGPDHARTYTVHLEIQNRFIAEGEGKSRKDAEREAAKKALKLVEKIF